jgi:hypothetical protein
VVQATVPHLLAEHAGQDAARRTDQQVAGVA